MRRLQKAVENYDPTTGTFKTAKKEKVAPTTAEERLSAFTARVSSVAAKLYAGHEEEIALAMQVVAEQLCPSATPAVLAR